MVRESDWNVLRKVDTLRIKDMRFPPGVFAVVCLGGWIVVAGGGCAHAPQEEGPEQHFHAPEVQFRGKPVPALSLNLTMPPLDLSRLDLDNFFPADAKIITAEPALHPVLKVTSRTRFPSTDECVSPDGRIKMVSYTTATKQISVHWLSVAVPGVMPIDVFHSVTAVEAIWSPDSQRIALTDFVGHNRSEISLVEAKSYDVVPLVSITGALERYFHQAELTSPCFIKAYRWTDHAGLVVRGIGQVTGSPSEEFGYEVLVSFDNPAAPQVAFIKGYTKEISGS